MLKSWTKQLEEMYEQMVEWRRHMHQHPELSYQEVETSKMVASILESFGIEVRTNVGGGGVVGTIQGANPGKTIALRADFDALPINDEKDVPYKSKVPGVMHACGHDGHTATLLAVAKVLSENRLHLTGKVILLHQHAEEHHPGGAIAMVEDGCLEGVDAVFGTHLISNVPTGVYAYRSGNMMAAGDRFEIAIQGLGGHGASPHQTVDSITIGAQIINQLQHIVSRQVDPLKSAVLSIGSFHAGNAPNVIADTAVMTGTVRTFDEDVRDHMEREIEVIAKGICSAFHATCEVSYTRGYPAVYNHPEETQTFVDVISKNLSKDLLIEIDPIMGSEDFSYYLKEKPGMFFFTGAGKDEIGANFPHHHPRFDFDEKAMIFAGKGLLSLVYHYICSESVKDNQVAVTG